jgi:hypothetical protein
VNRLLLGAGIAAVALVPMLVLADVGPPAHLQVTEREPGLYAVQWRVPKALPARAGPTPLFPQSCRPVGERSVADQPGAWLFECRWRCDISLAGQPLGMRYPFPDLALTTVVRVDLLSGDRFAHVLTPGEGKWLLPEGTAAPDLVLEAKRAVLSGATHVLGSWTHLAFLLTLGLLGGLLQPVRLVYAFTLGQVVAVILVAATGIHLDAVPAEIGVALTVVLLAREAVRPAEQRSRLWALVAGAGLAHGLGIAALLTGGLGEASTSLAAQLLAILGMDAAHLVGALTLAATLGWLAHRSKRDRSRRAIAYGTGAAGMALALGLALGVAVAEAGSAGSAISLPGAASRGPSAGVSGSRRVAPAAPDAPIQSFLAIEPFEVRHEAMLRIAGLARELDLDPASTLDVRFQAAVVERLVEIVLASTSVQVAGDAPAPLVRRADFMTVDPTGALPRPTPVPEQVNEAVIGVVIAYPTPGMAETVSFAWDTFPVEVVTIPATVIDPESVSSHTLNAARPSLSWQNQLAEDPVPTVAAVAVEPLRLPVPVVSLPLLLLSAVLLVAAFRGRRPTASFVTARVVLTLAFLVGPTVQIAVALPGSAGRTPSERQVRRILSGLLPNIYRALEFRDEAAIYDRLAVSVTGETLTDVYLEQRRALEIEERGGAQARVEAVEVLEASHIEPLDNGFDVRAVWTVGGMVTHFGHRHFRQNRYDARLDIVPVEGTWKIRSIEVLEQERVR